MPAFMKLGDIKGESTDRDHKDWINLLSWSWGASQTPTSGRGGGGAGKVSMQDFHFVRTAGKGSPSIFLACCNGRHFPDATMEFTSVDGSGQPQLRMRIKLKDVIVTSFQSGGDAGGQDPVEQISLNFGKIEFSQAVPGGFEEVFWDVRSNTGGGGQP